MKILKIVSIVIVTVVALAVAGFFLFFNPPSAETYCEKVLELTKQEFDIESDNDGFVNECVEIENRSAEMNGLLEINEQRRCIIAAETFEEAGACTE